MKSRTLLTTPVLVVSNYQITQEADGKYLHRFTPESTDTVYQFVANRERCLDEGARYNVGYFVVDGKNWVDMSVTTKADQVDKFASFNVAKMHGEQLRDVETLKSSTRVTHHATDGPYLGRKYAWRIYGMAIPRDTFDAYLEHIRHPSVPCQTDGTPSIAYKEEGLQSAMDALRDSCEHISGNRFRSILIPSKKWFNVKGISAITDKK